MKQFVWMRKLSLAVLLAAITLSGQSYDFAPLDQFLTQAAARIPTGLEVLIVENGRQIYWKQFGGWPRNKQAKIASGTKWYSAGVIMSLVDDGIVSLDDRASKYLPYMAGEKAAITIRQLMSHTSGFGGEFPLVHPCLEDPSGTLDQCAQALVQVPLKAPAGTAFLYSGAGMQIAGRVAEVASGKDWQTLFRERIAEPLGMTATDYEYKGPTRNPRISGGARSTASDYVRYLTMIYQRGVYNGRRILSTRAVDEMLSDQTAGFPVLESPFPSAHYGIGNWLDDPDNPGGASQNSSLGVAGWAPLIDRSRNLVVVVAMQNVIRPFQPYYPVFKTILRNLIPSAMLTPSGVTNAASYEAGPIAPDELLALFGSNLGPSQPVVVQMLDAPGPPSLAGTEVTFDGIPGSLTYTSAEQVLVVSPAEIAGKKSVQVQVRYNGTESPALVVPVAASWPALFSADASGRGQGAILNQDSSLNSASNPATRGSVVQLFGTGAGTANPNGMLQAEWDSFVETVFVNIGGVPATVSYAGPAPGLGAGVFQVNATVPPEVTPGDAVPVVVQAGRNVSLPIVTLAVR